MDSNVSLRLPSLAKASSAAAGRNNINSSEFAAVLSGADVGLALFDSELRLLACNELYRSLCGYRAEDTQPGTNLTDLIRQSLSANADTANVELAVEKIVERLRIGSSYSFTHTARNGRRIEVNRRRLESGAVVETVRETKSADVGNDLNSQFAHIAQAARERMMHALDVMADGFALFDANDRLVVYNRNYVKTKPLVEDLIVPGIAFETMLRSAVERGTYVTNGMDTEAYFQQRMHFHRNPGTPYEVHLTDGRWILVSEKRTADGGIVGIRSDITEMKSREFDLLRISRKLHAKNAHFDLALNNMIQGLCMFDSEQRLIVCNRRYLELYGFSADVVKPGIQLYDIMKYSVSLGNYTAEEAERALAERPDPSRLKQRTTIKQRLKDGRTIAVMNEPMPDGGSIATYHDITEIETHAQALQAHAHRLEISNRELQEFAYVASHDLQEPLRKIEAFSDRLIRKYRSTLPDDGQMFIDRMQNAAGRMRQLITALLAYSRVSSKNHEFSSVDLGGALSEVISDLQIRIEEVKGQVIAEKLPTIEADPTQIRQLLQNILSNALKFRKENVAPIIRITGKIEASATPIEHSSGQVVLTVEDNGIGFDNAYKEQIFKIFQRLHGKMEYEGTGIGLATCRKIVDRHDGTIDANGRPGEGTTFTIVLPVMRVSKANDELRPLISGN